MLALIEYPLRSLVFAAQVSAGMWKRNGYAVLNQVCNEDMCSKVSCMVSWFSRNEQAFKANKPHCLYRVSQKVFTRLVDFGIKSILPIFKTEMFIYLSKANLAEKILKGKSFIFNVPEK